MAKKSTKQSTGFWQSPAGYFISTAVLWIAGYILGSFAIDTGSIAQWIGTIIALLWGAGRLIQGMNKLLVTNKAHGKRR